VPFVAFGFVDNTVLIQAGDLIDNTFGVYFALPTLAAAAMGQVFSDTSGVLFGSYIEMLALKLGLPMPKISPEQVLWRRCSCTYPYQQNSAVSLNPKEQNPSVFCLHKLGSSPTLAIHYFFGVHGNYLHLEVFSRLV